MLRSLALTSDLSLQISCTDMLPLYLSSFTFFFFFNLAAHLARCLQASVKSSLFQLLDETDTWFYFLLVSEQKLDTEATSGTAGCHLMASVVTNVAFCDVIDYVIVVKHWDISIITFVIKNTFNTI